MKTKLTLVSRKETEVYLNNADKWINGNCIVSWFDNKRNVKFAIAEFMANQDGKTIWEENSL